MCALRALYFIRLQLNRSVSLPHQPVTELLVSLSFALGLAAVASGRAALTADRRLRELVPRWPERRARGDWPRFSDRMFVRLVSMGAKIVPIRWVHAPTSDSSRLLRDFYLHVLIAWSCGALAVVLALEVLL